MTFDRHEQQRIWVTEAEQQTFNEALVTGQALLIRGLPGSGKTTMGLELASRHHQISRIYYATFQDTLEVDGLWKTAHRHCQVPSLFVLDDCHLNLQAAQIFRERLSPELRNGQAKILFLGRDVELSGEETEEYELIEELREDGLVIDFKQDVNRTKEFIEFLRSDFVGLSPTRLERLHYSTGGDFLLLDEVLQDEEITPPDIDRFTPSQIYKRLYERLSRHYIKSKSSLQIVRRLASLAQFDLLPLSRVFADSWNRDRIAQEFSGLIGEVMGPPRYRFLHSSLSELVFNALLEREMPKDLSEAERQAKALGETQQELISYFQRLLEEVNHRNYSVASLIQDLKLVIFCQLKLRSSVAMAELKTSFVQHETIIKICSAYLDQINFSLLRGCQTILADSGQSDRREYVELTFQKLQKCLNLKSQQQPASTDIYTGVKLLQQFEHEKLRQLQVEFGPRGFLEFIRKFGTIFELWLFRPRHGKEALRARSGERKKR